MFRFPCLTVLSDTGTELLSVRHTHAREGTEFQASKHWAKPQRDVCSRSAAGREEPRHPPRARVSGGGFGRGRVRSRSLREDVWSVVRWAVTRPHSDPQKGRANTAQHRARQRTHARARRSRAPTGVSLTHSSDTRTECATPAVCHETPRMCGTAVSPLRKTLEFALSLVRRSSVTVVMRSVRFFLSLGTWYRLCDGPYPPLPVRLADNNARGHAHALKDWRAQVHCLRTSSGTHVFSLLGSCASAEKQAVPSLIRPLRRMNMLFVVECWRRLKNPQAKFINKRTSP